MFNIRVPNKGEFICSTQIQYLVENHIRIELTNVNTSLFSVESMTQIFRYQETCCVNSLT